MTAEAIPFGGRGERQNPVAAFIEKVRTRTKSKEVKAAPRDETTERYLGIILVRHHFQYGLSHEDVKNKIKEFSDRGLSEQPILDTYIQFTTRPRLNIGWLDIGFQLTALKEYWPELLPEDLK